MIYMGLLSLSSHSISGGKLRGAYIMMGEIIVFIFSLYIPKSHLPLNDTITLILRNVNYIVDIE